MRKLISLTLIALFLVAAMPPQPAMASESLVMLKQEILDSMAAIETKSEAYEQKIRQEEKQIEQVVRDLQRAEASGDNEAIYELKNMYYANRSRTLKYHAEKVVTTRRELAKIYSNMELLENERKRAKKFGMGRGLDKNDPIAKQAVTTWLKGAKSLLDMVDTLSPGEKTGVLKSTLVTMNRNARDFFNARRDISLEEQRSFILDNILLADSIKETLGLEHDSILSQIYYVDANHIIRQFNKISTALIGNGFGIDGSLNTSSQHDEYVSTAGESDQAGIPTSSSYQAGWNEVGKF